MNRKKAQEKYKWNFSNLYKNFEEWNLDLNKVYKIRGSILNLKNKLDNKENFLQYLKLEKEKTFLLSKINQYAHLIDVDKSNDEYQKIESLLEKYYQDEKVSFSFIDNEFKKIGKQKILLWLQESDNESYIYHYNNFFDSLNFILSAKQEELLSKVNRSRNAISELYDSLAYADKEFKSIEWKNQKQNLSLTLYKEIMENSDPLLDQEKRKEAYLVYYDNFISKKHSFAKIYEENMQKEFEEKTIRNYKSILEMFLFDDKVSENIYINLINIGRESIETFKKYYQVIKKHFNFKKFYSSDRFLKITKEYNKKFNVEEGIKIVKDSLKTLGKEYIDNLEIAFNDNKIDYFEDEKKSEGAYSSGGNGVDPIILMNWDNSLGSINTLAHEIGHSVHTLFSEKYQTYPLNDYPIILAEVASTFNEHILFDYLYENTNDVEEKKYLLQQRILDMISTFYRQIQFADFEYSAHLMVENNEFITTKKLKDLFLKKQKEFGYDFFDDVENDSTYSWPYVSHFFQSPFYVYKYAIDIVASFKLYNDFKNGQKDNIINFLKLGGSKPPLEILKEVGVNFENKDIYKPFIDEINKLTDQLDKLLK